MMPIQQYEKYFKGSVQLRTDSTTGSGGEMGVQCKGEYDMSCVDSWNGQATCCASVIMTQPSTGKQREYKKCMVRNTVKRQFQISLDGLKVSQKCIGGSESGASYMTLAFLASIASIASMLI